MRPLRRTVIACSLALLALLIGPLGWWGYQQVIPDEHLSFYSPSRAAIAELSTRARESASTDPLGRITIEEELANEIFGLDHPYNRYDPQAIWTHEPHLNARRTFTEHPNRGWTMRTNSLGMRRDSELSTTPPDLRVLVVGDSHVDGICDNSENLCAIAEATLESEHPGASVEVLNCARGGHSPWNYLGVIEKHLALSPDVVVVTIYGGNDLTDVLMLGHIFSETKSRGLTPESAAKREEALAISHHILGQGYGSLLFFKDRPSELEFALTTTARVLEQISILCEDAGAELLLLYLPSPLAFPREQPANGELEIRALFELTPMDLALPSAFSQGLLSAARELQVPAFDLTSTLADCDACFWRTDLHLSVRGHRRVGERLSGLIQGLPRAAERLQG